MADEVDVDGRSFGIALRHVYMVVNHIKVFFHLSVFIRIVGFKLYIVFIFMARNGLQSAEVPLNNIIPLISNEGWFMQRTSTYSIMPD